ncbi:hypothetical protein ES703_57760 [subsurface metagenome]
MEYWKKVNPDGTTNTVESHSFPHEVPNAVRITKEEYDAFIASLPTPEPTPPLSTHISIIDAIDTARARPVRVKRVWNGGDYFHDCLVTESVKDQYLAGNVEVGDYVIVHFDDIGEQIVTAKVFKSW